MVRARARSTPGATHATTRSPYSSTVTEVVLGSPNKLRGELTTPKEWRVSAPGRLVGWFLVLVSAVGGVIGLLAVFTLPIGHWWVAAPLAGVCVLVALCAYRGAVTPSLVAGGDGIVVHNPLRRTELPWAMVAEISPSAAGVRIRRTDGRTLTAWAVQKSNWSIWTNRWTRADEVAKDLREEVLQRHSAIPTRNDRPQPEV